MYIFYYGTDTFDNYDLIEVYQITDVIYEKIFLKDRSNSYFFFDKNIDGDSLTIFNSELDIAINILSKMMEHLDNASCTDLLKCIIKIFYSAKQQGVNVYILYFC